MSLRQSLLAASGALMLGFGGMILPSAHAATPQPIVVGKSITVVGVVESVDPITRQILLSGPDGQLKTVTATQDMRNFAQIRAGDRLYLTFRKIIAVALVPSGQPLSQPAGLVGGHRAALGHMPGSSGFAAIREEVRVDEIDRRQHLVTVTDAAGMTQTVDIHNTAMIHFADKLKKGDTVQIDVIQSVSIKLRPDPAA
ncbi:hypothetical protein ACELLULO517_00325 [Acidisoma cellulosilytica]|uniref:DUF5666 domain-containing protein n=1 Tax=Acidisoma cellulosilyticum TaxID=2802395 RepID=A0A963YWZ7_9PROT|nr:hypothetical protein [Acidisoma cellulosilyticum]MCB8878659.1 hypothetical protein [Acidisoma cellulosilyticum]